MKKLKTMETVMEAADVGAMAIGAVLRTALKVVCIVVLSLILTILLFAVIFSAYVKNTLAPELNINLEDFSVSLSSKIYYYDKDGNAKELVTLSSLENRVWVSYDEIPRYMEKALVSIEVKRFYEHRGVDWYRTIGAFANMFLTMKNEFGGSTITQQLIKNVTDEDDNTVARKLTEMFRALELEKKYTKEEIVEWYLNIVYFGEGCNGVSTAAKTYFGKSVSDLTLAEAASIIGITNNPSKYDPFRAAQIQDPDTGEILSCREWNKRRQETILFEMYDQGFINYETYKAACEEELKFVRSDNESYKQEIYSYYVEAVRNDVILDLQEKMGINADRAKELLYYGGYSIYCCMDPEIQAIVDRVYEDVDNLPKSYYQSNQQLQSAVVICDKNGNIVALRGGVGEKTINFGTNRATQSRRPTGSSIKPLAVYGPAMEAGLITQSTLVNDDPGIRLTGTNWYPYNTPNSYAGIITIRQALAASKNTVSAQILDKLGLEESYNFLKDKLGFTSLDKADLAYAPLALGEFTYGITVREMAAAYATFINGGVYTESRTYTKVVDSKGNIILNNEPETVRAFSENTAANMCDMLHNAVVNGSSGGRPANFPNMSVAGKTGSSSSNRDRYFCGFTPYYAAAVWTGYDMPETMYFGANPAVQIFRMVMEPIHKNLEYASFPSFYAGGPTNIFGDLQKVLDEMKEKEEEERRKAEEEEARKKAEEEEARRKAEEEEQRRLEEEAARGETGGNENGETTPPPEKPSDIDNPDSENYDNGDIDP